MSYKITMQRTSIKQERIVYEGEIELEIKGKFYKIIIRSISNPTPPKLSAYISCVKDSGGTTIKKAVGLTKNANRYLCKLLLSIDIKLNLLLKNNSIKMPWKFSVTDNIKYINDQDLSDDEIALIRKSRKNNTKLFSSWILYFLKEFINKWSEEIKNEGIEQKFENLLKEYKNLIPILFGFHGEPKFQSEHCERKENIFDIEGDNWIIELKKPSTVLFAKKGGRNNISGISADFISADNQLDLYIKKKNRKLDLPSSFTRGLLIIGKSDSIKTEEDKFAFLNMCEKSQSKIMTFDDVLEEAKILKKNLISKR